MAIDAPQYVTYDWEKKAKPTGIVIMFGLPIVMMRAHRKLFQLSINVNIPATIKMGLERGSIILNRTPNSVQPSTMAASRISFGIVSKNCLNKNIVKPFMAKGRISPPYVPTSFRLFMMIKRGMIKSTKGSNMVESASANRNFWPKNFSLAKAYPDKEPKNRADRVVEMETKKLLKNILGIGKLLNICSKLPQYIPLGKREGGNSKISTGPLNEQLAIHKYGIATANTPLVKAPYTSNFESFLLKTRSSSPTLFSPVVPLLE